MKYARIKPKIDPIKSFLILIKPKLKVKKSLNQEKKVMKATAKIIPGIAYPEIENRLR